MHSIQRSCHSALRSSANICVFANGSRRAFSRSCAHSRGALPVYLEPSTPELSSLLSTFNTKVLLPSHLTKEQEALVYRNSNKAKLEAEPVEITLGDVTIPLEHIDRNRLPNRWKSFSTIVRQSETKEDWENVVRMLEGFENAGIHIKPGWHQLVVRHLNNNGMQHLVLKALQRPKATGLRMRDYRLLQMVLRGIHDKAALSDWDKEETSKALRFAKQAVELLEDEEHCGGQGRGEMASQHDWRGKPAVVALPTGLAAVLAERHGGDLEDVKKLAGRLMGALKQDNNMTETLDSVVAKSAQTPNDFTNGGSQIAAVVDLTRDLLELVFVWNALKTSRKVLGASMPQANEAQQIETRIEQVLKDGLASADKLLVRDGKSLSKATSSQGSYVDYVKDVYRRCQ